MFLAVFCTAAPALAGSVSVAVADANGKPVAGAVVELQPDAQTVPSTSHVANEAVIDQRHEMFIPLVSLVRKGGRVTFTNNDTTKHQVYSFSPIKQFEFEIDQGQRSAPVIFDKPGIASIGCNIHDQMITYVDVTDAPFAAITGADGRVRFDDVPAGVWHANAWHPQVAPGRPTPSQGIAVTNAPANVAIVLPLMGGPMPGMKPMHAGKY